MNINKIPTKALLNELKGKTNLSTTNELLKNKIEQLTQHVVDSAVLTGNKTNLSTTNAFLQNKVAQLERAATPQETITFQEAIHNNQLIKNLKEDVVSFMNPVK